MDKVAWYVFLRAAGDVECVAVLAPLNTVNTVPSCSTAETAPLETGILGALITMGGGRFLPPTGAEAIGGGARRVGTGGSASKLGDNDKDAAPGSCKALKFLFFLMGLIGDDI